MSLLQEYWDGFKSPNPTIEPAKRILFAIVRDFTDRRGLRQEWEQIDGGIQEEILEEWLGIINKELGQSS